LFSEEKNDVHSFSCSVNYMFDPAMQTAALIEC